MAMKITWAVIVLSIFSCSGQQQPVQVEHKGARATVQKWVGGAPGSGQGWTLTIPIDDITGLQFDRIEHRGVVLTTESIKIDNAMIVATYDSSRDALVKELSDNPKEGLANGTPPIRPTQDQLTTATVYYLHDGKSQIMHVSNILEMAPLYYPAPPRGERQ